MNLHQLYELRLRLVASDNSVVSKQTVLAILDSHIRAISTDSEPTPPNKVNVPQIDTQKPRATMTLIERVRHPPSVEMLRKAYGY